METKNVVSIFAGHDANITFFNAKNNSYHIIELERLTGKRYFRLHVDNDKKEIKRLLIESQNIAEDFWGIENNYDTLLINSDGWIKPKRILKQVFNYKKIQTVTTHHYCHASAAFYQSPYDEAIIFSYDGGGDDGFFNIYKGDRTGIKLIDQIESEFGGGYLIFASLIKEVAEKSSHQLALSGKMMGLCAYGNAKSELIDIFESFYLDGDFDKLIQNAKLPLDSGFNPWKNPLKNYCFEGNGAYNLAATAQKAFENAFIKIYSKFDQNLPICLTGGAALNVLLNQRILDHINPDIFIPPNPSDCGLSLGHLLFFHKPKERVKVSYSGLPLLDRNELFKFTELYNAKKLSMQDVAHLLKQGKIIGMVFGDSEVGPRALGHRSILCDPKFPNMKEIINSKVKFREWYRPFAPICRDVDSERYFSSRNFKNMEFMGFAPQVKDEFKNILPSVTHFDGSSRLQIVSSDSCPTIYELLSEFDKISETAVLLNTSFNVKGRPILSTIQDALSVLESTELDGVLIEEYYFEKNDK